MSTRSNTWRVAYIGAGAIVKYSHVPNFGSVPNCTSAAICDVNEGRAARLAAEAGIPVVYTDYRRMLDEVQPDITVVAAPNILHPEMAIAALEAGSHVLCEKPMAPNYAKAAEMFEVARAADRILTVGSHMRFGDNAQVARRQANAGFFGKIYASRSTWHRRSGIPGYGGWFTNRSMSVGGVLLDLGVHALDRALYLMDYPRPVTVSGATFAELGPLGRGRGGWGMDAMEPNPDLSPVFDVDDMAWAFIRFDTGAVLQFQVAWATHFPDFWTTELFGTQGGAFLDERSKIELYSNVNGDDIVHSVPNTTTPSDSYRVLVHNFVRRLDGDLSAEIVTPEQALISVKIVDAILRSAHSGREVNIE